MILKLLSEEVFDFSRGELTQASPMTCQIPQVDSSFLAKLIYSQHHSRLDEHNLLRHKLC